MGPVEIVVVESKKVNCNGAKGASTHPLVYLNMGEKDYVICPYCSKYFTTRKSASNSNFIKEVFHKK